MTEEYDAFQSPIEEWLAARRKARGLAEGEDGGFVLKNVLELSQYTIKVGDLVFVPTDLAYDDDACCLVAQIWEPSFQSETRTFIGPIRDGVFHFTGRNTRLTMELRTNVIKKNRRLSEVVPEATKEIAPHIRMLDGEIIMIDRAYADSMLTDVCRRYAEDVTDTHYYWTLEEFGWAVVFELPALFGISSGNGKAVHNLAYHLSTLAKEYLKESELNDETYYERLEQNLNKTL